MHMMTRMTMATPRAPPWCVCVCARARVLGEQESAETRSYQEAVGGRIERLELKKNLCSKRRESMGACMRVHRLAFI